MKHAKQSKQRKASNQARKQSKQANQSKQAKLVSKQAKQASRQVRRQQGLTFGEAGGSPNPISKSSQVGLFSNNHAQLQDP